MQRTAELGATATLLFQQVADLDIDCWTTGFNIWQEGNTSYIDWVAGPWDGFLEPYTVYLNEHPLIEISEAKRSGRDFFVQEMEGDDITENYRLLSRFLPIKSIEKMQATGLQFPTRQINHYVFGAQVSLMFITFEPCPEAYDIFKRFGKVFEQTYTRFLDLQKAEEQTKEAQIEAALERVRSKAMAMRSSEDIGEATTILFKEIEKLEIKTMRSGILIIHQNKVMDVWTTSTSSDDKIIQVSGQIDMTTHPLFKSVYSSWKAKEVFKRYELKGQDGENYYKALTKAGNYKFPNSSVVEGKHYNNWFNFNEGALFAFTKNEIHDEVIRIFQRFAKVFGLTYQRYRELIESEKREKETKKQSSLDRVRGEIASMRST